MSNLMKHAKVELDLIGACDKDSAYNGMLGESVLELVEVFSKQGHSGNSAGLVRNLFNKVADYKPLSPLTFKDDEWNEHSTSMFQNKRNSAVFKDGKDGRPYYGNAYYKKTQTGSAWSGSLDLGDGTRVAKCFIKDPKSMPKVCIDVIETEVSKDNWDMVIKDIKQLDELKKYYDLEITTV